MRYSTFTNLMTKRFIHAFEQKQTTRTVGVFGPPGTGKTATSAVVAKEITAYMRRRDPNAPEATCRVLDLSSMLPEDLLGLPFRDGDVTRYCPHGWLKALCQDDAYGVLVLDDLPAATPAMSVAARQLVLERRVHDHRISDNILIMVTGNRREDKSAASTLPAHFRNSILLMEVQLDIDEWVMWYGQQDGLNMIVPAFLRYKQENLSKLPKDGAKDDRGAFATPRSWAMLGAEFDIAEETETTFEVARSLVGKGIATEFMGFVKIRNELVDPNEVLEDPQGSLPDPGKVLNRPDKIIAMSTSLGEVAATRYKKGRGKKKDDAPLKLLRALAWTTRDNREYCGTGVHTFLASAGGDSLAALLRIARTHRTDPVVGRLLVHLKSALLEGM